VVEPDSKADADADRAGDREVQSVGQREPDGSNGSDLGIREQLRCLECQVGIAGVRCGVGSGLAQGCDGVLHCSELGNLLLTLRQADIEKGAAARTGDSSG